MATTITITPASPAHIKGFARIDVLGLAANDATTYDPTKYPTELDLRYYVAILDGTSTEVGRTPVFTPNPRDGNWTFNNYLFPTAGAYTLSLRNARTNAVVSTQAVTIT